MIVIGALKRIFEVVATYSLYIKKSKKREFLLFEPLSATVDKMYCLFSSSFLSTVQTCYFVFGHRGLKVLNFSTIKHKYAFLLRSKILHSQTQFMFDFIFNVFVMALMNCNQ